MKETVKCIGIIMFGESNLLDRIEKEYISCETTTEKGNMNILAMNYHVVLSHRKSVRNTRTF